MDCSLTSKKTPKSVQTVRAAHLNFASMLRLATALDCNCCDITLHCDVHVCRP